MDDTPSASSPSTCTPSSTLSASHKASSCEKDTVILPISTIRPPEAGDDLDFDFRAWFQNTPQPEEAVHLRTAAAALQESSIPVAFPTETVYGLGADATRSTAVRGIYTAKQRPSDNPLIVHIGSLKQLRKLIQPSLRQNGASSSRSETMMLEMGFSVRNLVQNEHEDPLPSIYQPLIRRFWPGPLTILLPVHSHSTLAPEVTSGLSTFGARMPSSPLARLLISLADRPLAAPSANASTRPSPTTAAHVYHDLKGRIDIILDGGSCDVGVESTVVDGLSDPPVILRPGGIGIEEIRALGGRWAGVTVGYQDRKQYQQADSDRDAGGASTPRAPGMKYKHYAPRARVFLLEVGADITAARQRLFEETSRTRDVLSLSDSRIGIIQTRSWEKFLGLQAVQTSGSLQPDGLKVEQGTFENWKMFNIALGADVQKVAKALFSALRYLDQLNCDIIMVEGVSDLDGDLAAAVMNRLRKAAELDTR